MISNLQSLVPWLASARRSDAVPTGILTVPPTGVRRPADGPAKLWHRTIAPAYASALPGRVAAIRGDGSATGTPAIKAMPTNEQTQHFTNGGLRGPHPWSHPVTT